MLSNRSHLGDSELGHSRQEDGMDSCQSCSSGWEVLSRESGWHAIDKQIRDLEDTHSRCLLKHLMRITDGGGVDMCPEMDGQHTND
jgi:hypothetical protein